MNRLLMLAVLLFVGCDAPTAPIGNATHCTMINTPVGCPTVYRITDPDTGAVLYVVSSGALTLLPKGEVQAEKPTPAK